MRRLSELAVRDWPYGLACAHAAHGEHDAAIAWLEKAYAARAEDLWAIKGDVFLRSLTGDPRYKALLRKMNLPDQERLLLRSLEHGFAVAAIRGGQARVKFRRPPSDRGASASHWVEPLHFSRPRSPRGAFPRSRCTRRLGSTR